MEPIESGAFIIMSGHPEKGRRERVGKVRSIMAKRRFDRERQKASNKKPAKVQLRLHTAPVSSNAVAEEVGAVPGFANPARDGQSLFPNGLPQLLESIEPHLSDAGLASETRRRMCQFLANHMRVYGDHPFLRTVLPISILNPPLMSSKLLNASSFDDLEKNGEISTWTYCQRAITVRLLGDCLSNPADAYSDATLAALLGLAAFEVACANTRQYCQLRITIESICSTNRKLQRHPEMNLIVTRALLLTDIIQSLLVPAGPLRAPNGDTCYDWNLKARLFPSDYYPFTYKSHGRFVETLDSSSNNPVNSLLQDLYHVVSIALSIPRSSAGDSTIDYIQRNRISLEEHRARVTRADGHDEPETEDVRLAPLRLVLLILTTCMLSGIGAAEALEFSSVVPALRRSIQKTYNGLELRDNWMPFPGALLWCYSVGIRFSCEAKDRSWFILHMIRVAHPLTMEEPDSWVYMKPSLHMISEAVERVWLLAMEKDI